MTKRIKIKIDPLGNPTVEAEGFAGEDCTSATRGLEQALSGTAGATRELKPEYYTEGGEDQQVHQSW